MKQISVITVTYNCASTLQTTIDSVVNQTYSNIEYIIVDGASTDGTRDIIKANEDKITRWISEPDKGIYDAMNKGIAMATGEWIHFRNSGDCFFNNNSVSDMFVASIDKEVCIVHGDCRQFTSIGYCDSKPAILSTSYKKRMPVFHPSSFIRASLHKNMLYDLQYKSSADYDFFYKCLDAGYKFEYRPIIISVFNIECGFSQTNWRLRLRNNYNIQVKSKTLGSRVKYCLVLTDIYIRLCIKSILPKRLVEKIEIANKLKCGWHLYKDQQ